MIEVTDKAIQKVEAMLKADDAPGKNLRIYVEGGGCSGLQYGLRFDDDIHEDDETIDCGKFLVVVDRLSLPFLEGARVDYLDSLMESGFKILNPQAKSTCGCGQSFST
jgi:iron-sulfur cluster assembly accessory protein